MQAQNNIKIQDQNGNSSKPLLECVFCEGKGLSKYIDMSDETIPFGVVDWDKHCKTGKCPECNGSGLNVCNN